MSSKTSEEVIDFHQDQPYPHPIAKVIEQDTVFEFPDGVPAFEDSKRFTLILNDDIEPFVYLKSLDIKDLGFVCIDPFLIDKKYLVNLSGLDKSLLGIDDPADALVLTTVTVHNDPKKITTNMRAPFVINMENNVGRQVILENSEYEIKHKIWDALESLRGGGA
jgi:flagellar assembly factor FliW